ncbi:hypothetical protein QYF61_013127 [Mycteria americana]|uniref:Uncharacterized protein n=1 Tax=Mycteria americana TaxID=33587 RepID=A0AAN7NMI3_MYCAM|nr:hypothetical protein QYF61_013127 [Mycteria americana]
MQYCSPGYSWPSGLRVHIASSCLAFHPPGPPSPSPQGCSESLHLPACTDMGVAPTQAQDLALGLVEPHEVRTGPPLKPLKVPLDGIPSSSMLTTPHSLVSLANLLRVHSIPLSVSLMKILSSTGPTIDHYPLDATIQPIPHPLNSPPIKSISLQFKMAFSRHQLEAASTAGHLPLDQVAQSPIQPGLEHFQGWGIHSFSGQPVPVPHHPHMSSDMSDVS